MNENLNITLLTDMLWTGGDLPDRLTSATRVVKVWQRLGIRAVIDTRCEWDDSQLVGVVAPEIAYLHAEVDDAGQKMPDEWFDTVTGFALDRLAAGDGVLVHCHMGINRGPSAAYAVLLASDWDPIEAIDLIRTARPIAAVGYAEDALAWWHRRSGLPASEKVSQRSQLRRWRRKHPHDTVRIIREHRAAECTR
jgi:dual specificity phosphatase 3